MSIAGETFTEDLGGVTKKKRRISKKAAAKIISCCLLLCIIAAAIAVPVHFGGIRETRWAINGGKVQYPYVLVHGLGGWGEDDDINSSIKYWGADSCDIVASLKEKGYKVCAPGVGPFSSAWDRACELYAQLSGGTVDYGEVHATAHRHARYGRSFSTPLVENWGEKTNGGQRIKVNLVGHSFGGATIRLLASLLEYGSAAEMAAGGSTSALFTGGKGDWVNSVTTLCAPHNGSSLTCIIDSLDSTLDLSRIMASISSADFGLGGITEALGGGYDFKLDQFGFDKTAGAKDVLPTFFSDSGTDNALYDLSPDGAKELNKTIQSVESVYYFSFAYSTTTPGALLSGQIPKAGTLTVLKPTAFAMGAYSGTSEGGIVIDEAWQENDGLVNVISAKAPFDEKSLDWTQELKEPERGVWYVAPKKSGDHGTVIGLNADAGATLSFYTGHFAVIDALRR